MIFWNCIFRSSIIAETTELGPTNLYQEKKTLSLDIHNRNEW